MELHRVSSVSTLGHNYWNQLGILADLVGIGPSRPGLYHATVYHDEWCSYWSGGFCDCQPHILVRRLADDAFARKGSELLTRV